MRSFEERKKEIFRRSNERIKRRKNTKRIIFTCVPLCLIITCFVTVLFNQSQKKSNYVQDLGIDTVGFQRYEDNSSNVFVASVTVEVNGNKSEYTDVFFVNKLTNKLNDITSNTLADMPLEDKAEENVPLEPTETESDFEAPPSPEYESSEDISEEKVTSALPSTDSCYDDVHLETYDKNPDIYTNTEQLQNTYSIISLKYSDGTTQSFIFTGNKLINTRNNKHYILTQNQSDELLDLIK